MTYHFRIKDESKTFSGCLWCGRKGRLSPLYRGCLTVVHRFVLRSVQGFSFIGRVVCSRVRDLDLWRIWNVKGYLWKHPVACELEFYVEDAGSIFASENKENFKNERVMAITEENIRGKIGNSIFYRVGSVTRVRSVAARYADANTSKQRKSRSRLRVAIRVYRRLAETELRKVWYLATKGTGKSG